MRTIISRDVTRRCSGGAGLDARPVARRRLGRDLLCTRQRRLHDGTGFGSVDLHGAAARHSRGRAPASVVSCRCFQDSRCLLARQGSMRHEDLAL